jgi:serine protease Do
MSRNRDRHVLDWSQRLSRPAEQSLGLNKETLWITPGPEYRDALRPAIRRWKHGLKCALVFVGWIVAMAGDLLGQPAPTSVPMRTALDQLQAAVVAAIERAEPSVVAIGRGPRPTDETPSADAQAVVYEYTTGLIVDARGLILTNYHALGEVSGSRYTVWLKGARQFSAKVRAADPWTDLAVLEIAADNLQPIRWGNAATLRKGDFVVTLGNPYAIIRDGSPSASWGLIANLRARPTRFGEPATARTETLHQYGGLIETDAHLELGTSGGPIVNLEGDVVGLSTSAAAIFGYDVSARYAIPVDAGFRRVVDQLTSGGEAEFGFLGIQVDPVAPSDREMPSGVRVGQVVRASPAAASGLRFFDVITALDAEPVLGADDFLRRVGMRAPGENLKLTVLRDDPFIKRPRPLELIVTLAKKYVAEDRPVIVTAARPQWRGARVDYASAVPDLLTHLDDLDPSGCVAVVEVAADSSAWQAGLRPQMFISHVEQDRIKTPDAFFAAVEGRSGPVNLQLTAQAESRVVSVADPSTASDLE